MNLIARLTLLTTVCASIPACAQAPGGCGEPIVYSSTSQDGHRYEMSITQVALRDAPGWQPGQGEPPTSIGKAASIASTWADKHRGRFEELRINQMTLEDASCMYGDGHWYYRVDFFPVLSGKVMYTNGYFIAILMDGRVIESHKTSAGP